MNIPPKIGPIPLPSPLYNKDKMYWLLGFKWLGDTNETYEVADAQTIDKVAPCNAWRGKINHGLDNHAISRKRTTLAPKHAYIVLK